MTRFSPGTRSFVAGITMMTLLVAGFLYAQQPTLNSPPTVRDVRELSSVFRTVAKRTLPSIVSIQTTGRVLQARGRRDLNGIEGTPLERFFRSDPRLRGMLEQMEQQERRAPSGEGSGFIIDSTGLIMTNRHVVADAAKVTVTLHDGREFEAIDIKTDERSDVAVLRIDAGEALQPLPLGNSDRMEIGDWVLAIGSPFGYDLTVTQGIISAKGRTVGSLERTGMVSHFLQTDAAVNPGNSGGPLVNMSGEAIGLNTAISTRSGGYDGISFAIPINKARWVAQQLANGGKVRRAFLGITPQALDNQLARSLGLARPQGVLVSSVQPGSGAANAGIQSGDVITQLGGVEVTSREHVFALVEQMEIGRRYEVDVIRDGRRLTLPITLTERTADLDERSPRDGLRPSDVAESTEGDSLGIGVGALTDEARDRIGVSRGVLITSIDRQSRAAEAGLRPGFIIVRVGQQDVTTVDDYRRAIDAAEGDVLLLVHNGQAQFFVVVK